MSFLFSLFMAAAMIAPVSGTKAALPPELINVAPKPAPEVMRTSVAPLVVTHPKSPTPSVYMFPYSWRRTCDPNWHRMWINTAVLTGAFVSTLFVLECLPEDATAWNRASIQDHPFYERWYRNIFVLDPEIDHDNAIFNYLLHPYAGAVYFMSARSCGFNFFQSMLYSALISTIGWEFGIEACMERPSYQDLVITPVVGSLIGELFYRVKRSIVSHDYTLAGSRVLGNIVVFLVDPVNEVINLFRGSYERRLHLGREDNQPVTKATSRKVTSSLTPMLVGGAPASPSGAHSDRRLHTCAGAILTLLHVRISLFFRKFVHSTLQTRYLHERYNRHYPRSCRRRLQRGEYPHTRLERAYQTSTGHVYRQCR